MPGEGGRDSFSHMHVQPQRRAAALAKELTLHQLPSTLLEDRLRAPLERRGDRVVHATPSRKRESSRLQQLLAVLQDVQLDR
eukprot:COSAG06_NODE_3389_length_5413_cov_5.442040_4_plen_82_part_00